MKTLCIEVLLLLSISLKSQQHEILLPTNMMKWRTHANSNPNKPCDQSFRFENQRWLSTSCRNRGTNVCILATEKYNTVNIMELTLDMVVRTERPKKDLFLGYFATDQYNNKYRQIHDYTISAEEDNLETKFKHTINVTNFKDILLEFSNFYGYCGKIKEFKLSYKVCNQLEKTLVKPLFHGAPNVVDKQLRIDASCKKNASPTKSELYYTCLSNSSVILNGDCVCLPGYFRVHNNKCVKCPKYTYKPTSGNEECKTCGMHSYSSPIRNKCLCRYGFHREVNQLDNSSASCYSTKPLKLTISSITSNSAHIEWKVVNKSINWKKIHYTVDCDNCLDNEGNFPFQTYKHAMQLNDLEPSKKYVISVTSSSEEGIANTASTTIWGKFITAHASYGKDIITVTIISVIVPLVTITTTIFVYMYCRQKRKSEHLRKKISSLKRQRRPPKPPMTPIDEKDKLNNLSDTVSDINPYAVFVPPMGFRMCGEALSKEDVGLKCVDEKMKLEGIEQYESMGGIVATDYLADSSSENPYIQPSWMPNTSNHSYIDIKDADPTVKSPCLMQACKKGGTPSPSRNKYVNIGDEKEKTLVHLRIRPHLDHRVRATSCLYKAGQLEYTLDVNPAKLNNKYTRLNSKQGIDLEALIKRSHSADDINKLPIIL